MYKEEKRKKEAKCGIHLGDLPPIVEIKFQIHLQNIKTI